MVHKSCSRFPTVLLCILSSLNISYILAFSKKVTRPLRTCSTTNLSASVFVPGATEKEKHPSLRQSPLESNFWGRRDRIGENGNDQNLLPCIPSLDPHGELPLGAYTLHGNPVHAPKEACRISLVLDSEKQRQDDDELDFYGIVRSLQQYMDDGFQTFQVKSGPSQHHTVVEERILGKFLAETPGYARERCNIMLPLRVPSIRTAAPMSSTFVRRTIAASLLRLGSDAIDCIQIQNGEKSPYFLDVLDTLEDLKREGLVRSLSTRKLPPLLLREARSNGFDIHSNQLDCNLLDPTAYTTEQKLACSDLDISLIAENPLAGGLLSDRYENHMYMPLSTELSRSGSRQLKTTLYKWNQRSIVASNDKMTAWQRFYKKAQPILSRMALKHRVSVATICLRWELQLRHVSSTAVSYNLFDTKDSEERKTSRRIKSFRDVFRFELDDEDVRELWQLSGVDEPADELAFSFDSDDDDAEEFDRFEQRNGLYLP